MSKNKNSKKNDITAITIILILIVVIAGIFLYINNRSDYDYDSTVVSAKEHGDLLFAFENIKYASDKVDNNVVIEKLNKV